MPRSAGQPARAALAVGQRALPRDSGPRSRHDDTPPQLFARLVVTPMRRRDYRGVVPLVAEWGGGAAPGAGAAPGPRTARRRVHRDEEQSLRVLTPDRMIL